MCAPRLRVDSVFSARCVSALKKRHKPCREKTREKGFWNQKKIGTTKTILLKWGWL